MSLERLERNCQALHATVLRAPGCRHRVCVRQRCSPPYCLCRAIWRYLCLDKCSSGKYRSEFDKAERSSDPDVKKHDAGTPLPSRNVVRLLKHLKTSPLTPHFPCRDGLRMRSTWRAAPAPRAQPDRPPRPQQH